MLFRSLLLWFQRSRTGFFGNCLAVLAGRRTWVGLRTVAGAATARPAILSPADAAALRSPQPLNAATRRRLELLYAKDFEPAMDLGIVGRCWRRLGG